MASILSNGPNTSEKKENWVINGLEKVQKEDDLMFQIWESENSVIMSRLVNAEAGIGQTPLTEKIIGMLSLRFSGNCAQIFFN